ncbi:MAG: hypothetical protein MZW92_31225 [Comamonadaceae bacterium]|nr:hypothetical protein [Comamonadaceae bacterium]
MFRHRLPQKSNLTRRTSATDEAEDVEAGSEDYLNTVSYISDTDEFACRFEDGDVEYITPDNDPHLYARVVRRKSEREFKTREEEEEWYSTKSVM